MEDRMMIRVGAWAAVVGGIMAIVVNVFAPRPSADAVSDPTAAVDVAATSGTWEVSQVGILVISLLILAAFYTVTRSINNAPATVWARLGLGAALLGTTIGVVNAAIYASFGRAADSLGAEALASTAFIAGGLFWAWTITLFGLTALLYGLALITSSNYPTWLGWVTVLGGLAGLINGFIEAFAGPSGASLILFPISAGLLTLVILYIGVLLLRRSSPAAVESPTEWA